MVVQIVTPDITLGDALKWAGITSTGGQAKLWIRSGRVSVNGVVERRRGRRLGPGDRIAVSGREYQVVAR
jgi:ribosome-associated protein